jgi:hypothetical protein
MSKRGGFNGGGVNNMNALMKQAQKMQKQMIEAQQEMQTKEYVAKSGGGAVEVTISGAKEIKSIKISPEVVDPEDIEMLEDLVMAAVNEAIKLTDEASSEQISKFSGYLNGIDGLNGLF